MLIKILSAAGLILVIFLAYVFTRNGKFNYEKRGSINASPEKIFPYISQLKLGSLWSPYEKVDPQMKKTFSGSDGQAGAVMEFDGNKEAGSGRLEILKVIPNESVEIKLTMTKPFYAENFITYKLIPEGTSTLFSWSMRGDGGFLGKLMNVLIDCEKMVTDQFVRGIANLKEVVERGNNEI